MIYKRITSGDIASNTYILGCEKTREAVMIDPGYTDREADVFLDEEGLTLRYIIDTHGHADHIHNNAYFARKYGVPILIGEEDATYLSSADKNLSSYLGYELESPAAQQTLKDGDVIEVGTLRLDVLHTPGHTPGSISLRVGDAIFVGDLVFYGSVGRTDLYGGNQETLNETLRRKIFPLPDETLIFSGHGMTSTTVGEQKEINPFFRELLEGDHV